MKTFAKAHLPCFALALSLAGAAPAIAQNGLVALSPQVALEVEGGKCAFEPRAFETEGQTVAIWRGRAESPWGVFARTGPSLDQLGPVRQLNADVLVEAVQVLPLPGGFVAAWTRFPSPQEAEVVFQIFRGDLSPAAPEVVVGPAALGPAPALLAAPDSSFVVAHFSPAGRVEARRYTAAGAPLGEAIEVDPQVAFAENHAIRLAAGGDSFLVAFSGVTSRHSSQLFTRAFGWDGTPAAASFFVGGGAPELAWVDGSYLMVTAGGHHVRGYRLSDRGEYLEDLFDLPTGGGADQPRLLRRGDELWLFYLDAPAGLLGRRIAVPSLAVDPQPDLLVPQPADLQTYMVRASAMASAEGFLAAWQMAPSHTLPFPYPPCDLTLSLQAQAFGPAGAVVEVPTLPPAGLLGLELLLAAAGLLFLRRP